MKNLKNTTCFQVFEGLMFSGMMGCFGGRNVHDEHLNHQDLGSKGVARGEGYGWVVYVKFVFFLCVLFIGPLPTTAIYIYMCKYIAPPSFFQP